MKSKVAKVTLIALALVFILALAVSCAPAVTLEEYNRVVAERDVMIAEMEVLKTKIPKPSMLFPIVIYDKGELLEIAIEDVGKYHHEVCTCLRIAFRATQFAISELWKGEIPDRSDFKIISACPTLGTQDAFDFIARAKTGMKREGDFKIQLPKGTSSKNLSRDNFVFTFIRKSTGDSITIRVKEELFPEGFFELRKKKKFQDPTPATPEEKKLFKSMKKELNKKIITLPVNKLFELKRL
ncbi:hypothetical protein HQ584_04845 [Patescibacteria group bacterium]|nr:hypothetical protein [Patescibacteria group bacterium]